MDNLKDFTNRGVGISINHYTEQATVPRTTSFVDVAKKMKLKSLRWPEGELGESILWSSPPFEVANPVAAMKGNIFPYNSATLFNQITGQPPATMNLDEFVQLCVRVNAEPFVIVPIDAVQKPDGVTSFASEDQILQNAVEMVKYAKRKNYNIKYWEIGNENDLIVSGSKSSQRWTAQDYANFVVKISALMKAADPTIKIGANGMTSQAWWEILIKRAAPSIDFLVTHVYYNSSSTKTLSSGSWYDNYRLAVRRNWDFTSNLTTLNNSIDLFASEDDKKRLIIAVTETSSYSPNADVNYYPAKNTIGTGIVAFEILGKMLLNERMLYAHFWTSHWFGSDQYQLHNSLGPNNEILATGRAIQFWNEVILNSMVRVSAQGMSFDPDVTISAFHQSGKVNIVVLNRGNDSKNVPLRFQNITFANKNSTRITQFKGISPTDTNPMYRELPNINMNENNAVGLTIEPYSITSFTFDNNSQPTSVTGISASTAINISELDDNTQVHVFPNPTNDILNIQVPSKTSSNTVSLAVYDSAGKLVKQAQNVQITNNVLKVDIMDLPTGVYTINLQAGTTKYTKKIVVKR